MPRRQSILYCIDHLVSCRSTFGSRYLIIGLESRGVIGPKIQFGPRFLNSIEIYGLAAGAFFPLVLWIWRRSPWGLRSRSVSILLLTLCNNIPPGTGINYSSWFLVSFISRKWSSTYRSSARGSKWLPFLLFVNRIRDPHSVFSMVAEI